MSIKNRQLGFTLVEVAIVMPVVILVIGTLLSAILAMTNNVLVTRANNALIFSVQDALDRIEADVEVSGGYLATNNVTIASGQGSGSTDDTGTATKFVNVDTNNNAIILNMYATDKNPKSSDRNIVKKEDSTNSCTNSTEMLMYNIVYFIQDNSLWRRTVIPSDFSTITDGTDCTKPWQLPSCQGLTETFCKAKDEKLVTGIDALAIEYYDSGSIKITDASDKDKSVVTRQAAMASAASIKVTISASGKAGGKTFSYSGVVRTSSPNNNIDS